MGMLIKGTWFNDADQTMKDGRYQRQPSQLRQLQLSQAGTEDHFKQRYLGICCLTKLPLVPCGYNCPCAQ